MEKRRIYLIDRKTQFFFIRFILLYFVTVSAIFGYVIIRINNYFSDYIYSTITSRAHLGKLKVDPQLAQDLVKVLAQRDQEFLIFMLLAMLLVGLVIAYLTIRFSHRVSGPIYKIRNAMRTAVQGDYSIRLKLRKHDQLKDLAEEFNQLMAKLDKGTE